MVDVIGIFLLVLIGVIFYIIGRTYEDYTFGILGGFVIFLLGVGIIVSPVDGITDFINTIMASAFIGVGCYVWIWGSIVLLKNKGFL